MSSKKGQITIFVIIAIVLVMLIVGFFVVRNKFVNTETSSEFDFIYEYFDSCVEDIVLEEIGYAGMQAGYVKIPEFEPGSEFSPFSSQLDFLGTPVPYWYYVSGNNVVREQVPSLSQIENDLAEEIEIRIKTCDFSRFAYEGYYIETDEPVVKVRIRDRNVLVSVDYPIIVEKDKSREEKSKHEIYVETKFGKFYSLARKIYDKHLTDAFLENYALDVIYNYAPVTDVEIGCSPLIWKGSDVVRDIKEGLSANVGALKLKNRDEVIDNKTKYFVVDVESDEEVMFMYNTDWPTKIEVWPAEGGLLMAEPVGIQEGLGILGFCYVPYHFVYDVYHPVLIQIYDGNELFQFPVAVVVQKTSVRNPFEGVKEESQTENFCNYRETEIITKVVDFSNQSPVKADVIYSCLNSRCYIGQTDVSKGILTGNFPQCYNGRLTVRAEGYATREEVVTIIESEEFFVELKRLKEFDVEFILGGVAVNDGVTLISFSTDDYSTQIVYPEQKKVKLVSGFYEVRVQSFSSASLKIPASSSRQCVQIPSQGLLGFFGKTKEQCFDIEFPSQDIDMAIIGGGNSNFPIVEEDINSKNIIRVSVPRFSAPSSIEAVQRNYGLLESSFAEVRLG
jgi:hypothetical protein